MPHHTLATSWSFPAVIVNVTAGFRSTRKKVAIVASAPWVDHCSTGGAVVSGGTDTLFLCPQPGLAGWETIIVPVNRRAAIVVVNMGTIMAIVIMLWMSYIGTKLNKQNMTRAKK